MLYSFNSHSLFIVSPHYVYLFFSSLIHLFIFNFIVFDAKIANLYRIISNKRQIHRKKSVLFFFLEKQNIAVKTAVAAKTRHFDIHTPKTARNKKSGSRSPIPSRAQKILAHHLLTSEFVCVFYFSMKLGFFCNSTSWLVRHRSLRIHTIFDVYSSWVECGTSNTYTQNTILIRTYSIRQCERACAHARSILFLFSSFIIVIISGDWMRVQLFCLFSFSIRRSSEIIINIRTHTYTPHNNRRSTK